VFDLVEAAFDNVAATVVRGVEGGWPALRLAPWTAIVSEDFNATNRQSSMGSSSRAALELLTET
jgi:hypothetical protein